MVFCDFDGTITRQETFVAMLNQFVPEKMKEFSLRFAKKEVTLREGVRGVVESIPSSQYSQVIDFISDKEIRNGFLEFLTFLGDRKIPFIVISGGLIDSVKKRLAPYKDYIHAIYAAHIDSTGDYLKIYSKFEEDDELVAKVKVMSLYCFKESVAIGDGATDHKMALNSNIVFARKRLAGFLDQKGKKFVSWNDFLDIRDYLAGIWPK